MKYIKTTRDYCLVYRKQNNISLVGYSDSDHAGDLGDRKSTSGFVFMIGSCTVSWKSIKQKTVALSSTEAEYISLAEATQEALWLKELLGELGYIQDRIVINGDNLSSMQIVKNPLSITIDQSILMLNTTLYGITKIMAILTYNMDALHGFNLFFKYFEINSVFEDDDILFKLENLKDLIFATRENCEKQVHLDEYLKKQLIYEILLFKCTFIN